MESPEQQGHQQIGRGMIFVAALLSLGVLTFLFNQAIEGKNQNIESRIENGYIEVTLKADRQGHYFANGAINGQSVHFLLDTGATNVAIPESLADKLGLSKGVQVEMNTANGPGLAYLVRLDSVSLGSITQQNVSAAIVPGLEGEALLGMSFLKHVQLQQMGQKLVIRSAVAE
ncbi:MAG: retropepsin-like aspartic protease family protein [bacterium]